MSKPGPKPVSIDVLAKRGSQIPRRRDRKAERAAAKPVFKRPRARVIHDWPAILREIPGYDCYRDAGACTFDPAAAQRVIDFFERDLVHIKGALAGKPFRLERWQRAIIGCLFGWKRPDGTRRYRECLIFVGRKNGKSPLAAGVLAYLLFEDQEPGGEVYCAASEFRQASIVFDWVRGFVVRNPRLLERCKVYYSQTQRAIQLQEDFSTLRVVTAEASHAHGWNCHGFCVDELHCLPNADLVDALSTSVAARRQPLGVFITTSDYERAGSPCNARHEYATRVRDGIIDDPSFLPVIYEASRDDDWRDPETWRKANPTLGISVSVDYLAAACRKAQDSPAFENTFKRLHLNLRTAQDVRWIPMDKWDACAGVPVRLEDYRGRACWAGLDLATTRDMTALVMVFPEDDGKLTLLPIFWIPEVNAIERERRDRVPYTQWIREGWIRATPGSSMDYATIRRDINALVDDYGITLQEIAADRLFQGDQLTQELSEQDGLTVLPFGQGFLSMAAPTKRFEDLIIAGDLRHGGNPVLRWHASNVSVETDAAGNMKPSRKKSTEKIDGIVAAIMGVARAVIRTDTRSVYEDRGLIAV